MTLAVRELKNVSELGPGWRFSDLDAQECWVAGLSPHIVVERCLALSEASFVESVDAGPLCAWGYYTESLIGGVAGVWLLGTPLVKANPVAFCKRSVELRDHIYSMGYRTIRAMVWDGHNPAKRWLGWLGFSVVEVRGAFLVMQRTA